MSEKKIEVPSSGSELGAVFQAARLNKKLSIEQISQAIHLSEKQVQALENNDFNLLPEPVITRGFIRNYAKFLDIDAEPLLRSYRSLVPQEERSIVVKANVNEVMSQHAHQPWLLYVLGSILVLLFLTAWFYYMDSVKTPEVSEEEDATAVTEAENLTQNIPEEIMLPIDNQNIDSVTGQQVDGQATLATGQSQQPDTAINQTTTARVSPVVQPAQPLIAKKLEMIFSADSWVRVKDKTGQIILEKTATAGSTESLDADPPFNIIIGNSSAAKVKFYGQEVDLSSATSKNVVRLTLE